MVSFFIKRALQQYLAQHLASYLEEWRILSTVSSHGLDQAVLTCFQQHAVSVRFLEIGPSRVHMLYAESDAQAPYSLCFCLPPTSARQQLRTLITSLAALDAYRNSTASLPINVKWLLSGTAVGILEEASVATNDGGYDDLLNADGYLWDGSEWLDPEYQKVPLLALGCKGQLSIELTVQSAPTRLPSRYDAIVPNAAWRLTWALASLKDAREEILIDGFYDTLLPSEDDEIALLSTLPDDTDALTQRLGLKHLLMDLHGFQQHYVHLLTPTCTITHMNSGTGAQGQATLQHDIPATANARVDFQLVPGQDPNDIFNKIRRHLDTQGFSDIHAHMVYAQAPMKTPLHSPFVQHMRQATRSAYGHEAIILPLLQGKHPFCTIPLASAPTVIFTPGHGEKEEYLQPQQFLTAVLQLALLLERIQDFLA